MSANRRYTHQMQASSDSSPQSNPAIISPSPTRRGAPVPFFIRPQTSTTAQERDPTKKPDMFPSSIPRLSPTIHPKPFYRPPTPVAPRPLGLTVPHLPASVVSDQSQRHHRDQETWKHPMSLRPGINSAAQRQVATPLPQQQPLPPRRPGRENEDLWLAAKGIFHLPPSTEIRIEQAVRKTQIERAVP